MAIYGDMDENQLKRKYIFYCIIASWVSLYQSITLYHLYHTLLAYEYQWMLNKEKDRLHYFFSSCYLSHSLQNYRTLTQIPKTDPHIAHTPADDATDADVMMYYNISTYYSSYYC